MTHDIREIFYQDDKHTVYWTDIGTRFQIRGILIGDGNTELALSLPYEYHADESISLSLDMEEWIKFLRFSDDPQMVVTDEERKIVKAIVRKGTRQLNEIQRYKVFRRDNFTCQYCGKKDLPLTIDEYLCQDLGGACIPENQKTACRPCNKSKANKSIHEWEEFRKQRGLRGPND